MVLLQLSCVVLLTLQDAPAPLFEVQGRAPDDGFGIAVAGGGDVDGDGTPDVVVGAFDVMAALPRLGAEVRPIAGYAQVLSGRDGRVLLTLESSSKDLGFGLDVALLGDVNGDGHADVAVAAPNMSPAGLFDPFRGKRRGAVLVHSGADGALLRKLADPVASVHAQTSLALCGDLDGDGRPDLAVGHSGTDLGLVLVYSSQDWRVLLRVEAQEDGFGSALAGAGDVDGDGTPDVIVGGVVRVLSGKTGETLHAWLGAEDPTALGSAVAGIGDVDGDGRADLLIGASRTGRTAEFAGAAFVHSGRAGELLYSLDGPHEGASLGHRVGAVGDVNGDACPDFAVTTHEHGARARIHSGKDGALLIEYPGSSVALAGDLDGDGKPEIVTGGFVLGERGRVRVHSPARDLDLAGRR
jgi:hypothetical protein